MKVIFAALKYDYGIEARGESLEHKAFYPALKSNFEQVVPFWLEENGFPDDLVSLQEKLLETVKHEDPAYVFFILMEFEIFPETLLKIKSMCTTINWFCDDAWRYESYTKFAAQYFTFCITVDKYSINKYKEDGYKNVILSQWASFDNESNIDFNKIKYNHEISFIGSKSPTREWIINSLKKSNIQVECFGAGWFNGKVSYERSKEIILGSKINLNLSNSVSYDVRFLKYLIWKTFTTFIKIPFKKPITSLQNLKFYLGSLKYYLFGKKRVETVKARNFEIPGCGGFQLSQYALEIEDYYQIGKEISVFSNIDDLKKQINYYLFFNKEREHIRNEGYNRTSGHTYINRFNKMISSFHDQN
jgi:spore maturation protein CgeB